MSWIIKEFITNSPVLWAPVLALLIFIVVFGSVLVRVMRRPARDYDEVARLPLESEADHE